MSEQKKMTILQATADTVSAADMMGGPMPHEEKKRKGLPAADQAWTPAHDMVVMGRLARAVEGVPPAAMRRIAPWFSGVLNTACQEPADLRPLAAAYVAQKAG